AAPAALAAAGGGGAVSPDGLKVSLLREAERRGAERALKAAAAVAYLEEKSWRNLSNIAMGRAANINAAKADVAGEIMERIRAIPTTEEPTKVELWPPGGPSAFSTCGGVEKGR